MRTKEDIVFKVIQVVLIICIVALFLLNVYTAYLFSEKLQVPLFKTIVGVITIVFILWVPPLLKVSSLIRPTIMSLKPL